ncbi:MULTISPECIES: hypothetical protein [Aequorivita]|uniref:DUF481 domain-containing protein n=1 Tax=Aequorivita iocasae TaxID=2803865 RepID=A0ABX7DMS3_9FLAO|nr:MULTISPECIES: hypothetical protein [Aequorivita]QQX75269.1 hypothetical protein JK629_07830 [Aequorivita iocasae]UCA54717.1 hypothetical protein LDL78_07875 [Aequorivita sp. F7]
MLRLINFIIFTIIGTSVSVGQAISFTPEIFLGNRATAYQHFIGYKFNDTWSINNVSLYDTEYINDKNNIFFIRNMLSYNFTPRFKTNFAAGIKNPGKFATISTQYEYATSNFRLSYAIGSTYQSGFTLEQNLRLNYTPRLSKNIQGYINLFVVVNTNLKVLDRGIQQLRVGIKNKQLITGIGANLDQFTKAEKTLENFGAFIKYNF